MPDHESHHGVPDPTVAPTSVAWLSDPLPSLEHDLGVVEWL